MTSEPRHYMDEADIGSGEKSPGQHEVEQDVHAVYGSRIGSPLDGSHQHDIVDEQGYVEQGPEQGPQRSETPRNDRIGRLLQSGTHLARIVAQRLPDGSYEAQVYVRLRREPEIAETYIPAGNFGSESEAWRAAEERARRAFREHEF